MNFKLLLLKKTSQLQDHITRTPRPGPILFFNFIMIPHLQLESILELCSAILSVGIIGGELGAAGRSESLSTPSARITHRMHTAALLSRFPLT